MSERQPVLGQQPLGLRPAQTRLEGGGHRVGVDGEQPVEADQVERDDAGVPLASGDQATHDGGATTERDQGQVVLDAPLDDRGDLLVRPGPDDGVR